MVRKLLPFMLLIVLLAVTPMLSAPAGVAADAGTATATPGMWLTVTAPNGGETLTVGDVYRITWDSSLNIDTVTIGYSSCPSCLDWIVTAVPNAGYYDWTVNVGNTTNTQFKIEIIGYDTGVGSVTDLSDDYFTVLPSSSSTNTPTPTPTNPALWLTVTAPNGGETLTVGQVYRITWDSSSNIDSIYIGYSSCSSCLDWIVTAVPNTGYYDWTVNVGNTTNTQFKIEIIGYDVGVGSATDLSDSDFTVLPPPTDTPTPVVTAPVLLSPINGQVIRTTPTFDWSDFFGATGYTLQVSKASDFSSLLLDVDTTQSSYVTTHKLPKHKTLYWRVCANFGQNNSSDWASSYFVIR